MSSQPLQGPLLPRELFHSPLIVTRQGSRSVHPSVMDESFLVMTTLSSFSKSWKVSDVLISKLDDLDPVTYPYMSRSLEVHLNLCLVKVNLPFQGATNVELAKVKECDGSMTILSKGMAEPDL